MKDSNKIIDWITVSVVIITMVISIFSIYQTSALKKEVEIKLSQYDSMNILQEDIINTLYEWEEYSKSLKNKENLSTKEEQKNDEFIEKINILYAKMYIMFPDEDYKNIQNTLVIDKKIDSLVLREELLVAMRKAQYPDTEFDNRADIRFIKKQ